MSEASFVIDGRLPGLNEYIRAERAFRLKAAEMKAESEFIVRAAISQQLRGVRFDKPVRICYKFFEQDRRRDKDNIAGYAHKVIQDSLVRSSVLKGDGWSSITGFQDDFAVDKRYPRIEITIREIDSDS